jgi:hypothetical protein
MAWGVDLEDSGPAIDEQLCAKMREAIQIDKVAEHELPPEDAETYEEVFEWYSSCYGTVERLLKEPYYSPTYQKIEEYIDEGNGLDVYPRRPSTEDESTDTRCGDTWIPADFEGMSAADHSLEAWCETEQLAALAPLSPAESGNPLPAREDEWRFTIAFPMIWTPDIKGKIRGGERIDFKIKFEDILENLSFGLMFELYANRGPYGLAFRSNFMRVEDENSRSGILDTRIETTLDMGVNDLLASFRVHDKVRLVTGVRHVLAKLDVDIYSTLGPVEVINESITVTDDNLFDLLLGINFNHWINDKWGLMLNADLGVAGDNDRNYGAEFRALYRISDLHNFWFGYRYLDIGNDSTEDDITYKVDMIQQGLTLGWAFTF